MENLKITTIEEYLLQFPLEIQDKLKQIRDIIKCIAPEATEKICYSMPTFYLNGNLVHFAANKNHIGFYPTPTAIIQFKNELSSLTFSKGAIQFPYTQPLPTSLIKKIVEFRKNENLTKTKKEI